MSASVLISSYLGLWMMTFVFSILLATYMETKLSETSTNHRYLFCGRDDDNFAQAAESKVLQGAQISLAKQMSSRSSVDKLETMLARTDCMRKFPSTWCAEHGCTPFEIEVRGQWKQASGGVVNRYINPNQLPIDAKLAGILCVGGPVK
jgi:hypothetical protein